MWKGTLVAIHITPEATAPLQSVTEARLVAGKGLEGDRYFSGRGTWSTHPGSGREVTLIESEAIEALERESNLALAPAEARRNLVTRGVPLNHLVGHEFRVGEVRLRGIRLCEPCKHLEGLTKPGIREALMHRAGLRTEIVHEGVLRVGDPIEEV
jgi:MOSC domain-containing protein YiiM